VVVHKSEGGVVGAIPSWGGNRRTKRSTEPPPSTSASTSEPSEGRRSVSYSLDCATRMILLVLFLIFASLFLFFFITCWVFPRAATRLGISSGTFAAVCSFIMLLCFSVYAGWQVECPFCHAGHVDAQGRCRLGDQCREFRPHPQWSQMSEKERSGWTGDPGHWKAATCPWCRHTGKMSRIAIWKD
jgi:hypothetical protein